MARAAGAARAGAGLTLWIKAQWRWWLSAVFVVAPFPSPAGSANPAVVAPRERYLKWEREPLHCAGVSHQRWSFLAYLTEAVALNRTAVIPDTFCQHPVHNEGQYLTSPIDRLFNIEALRSVPGFMLVLQAELPRNLLAYTTTSRTRPQLLAGRSEALLVRKFSSGYWYELKSRWSRERCPQRGALYKAVYGLTAQMSGPVHEVLRALGQGYCALHVRRGDKAKVSRQLERDTRGGGASWPTPRWLRLSKSARRCTWRRMSAT